MKRIRQLWEKRANRSGASLKGVLFRGFSEQGNLALHAWHQKLVEDRLLPCLPECALVLDLGCGYGRIGRVIAAARADACIVGQDLAAPYCRMFHDAVGPVVQADLAMSPFKDGTFHGICAITALMYVEGEARCAVFTEIARLLRPGGYALLLDPGAELLAIMRLLGRRPSETAGEGFGLLEYVELAQGAGLEVVDRGGNPYSSAAFLFTLGGRIAPGVFARWLHSGKSSGGYSRAALHRWLLVRRRAGHRDP